MKKASKQIGVLEKRRHKIFMTKTAGCYRTLVKRSAIAPTFSLDSLRVEVQHALDHGACPYCFGELKVRTFSLDHRVPISRGGTAKTENLVICCIGCNKAKGEMTEQEFHALMEVMRGWDSVVRNDVIGRLKAGAAAKRLRFLRR